MQRPRRDTWLALDWAGQGPLTLTRTKPESVDRLEIRESDFLPAWEAFLAARQVARKYAFSTFDAQRTNAVAFAQGRLRDAFARIYKLFAPVLDSLEGLEPTFRCEMLRCMPLAAIVAAERLERIPLDVHPDVPASAIERVRGWQFPAVDSLTILLAKDLGELRSVTDPEQLSDGSALAHLVRWRLDLTVAIECAAAAGARVVRPVRVEDVVRCFDGEFGPHVMVVAHLDDAGNLACDDGLLSLPRLQERVEARRGGGWTSSVQSVDLSICRSAGLAANVFLRAGIEQVSCIDEDLQISEMTSSLRRMFERGLVDGTRPMAHAWMCAGANSC